MTDNGLKLDQPEPFGHYLGVGQSPTKLDHQNEVNTRMSHIKPLFSAPDAKESCEDAGSSEEALGGAVSPGTTANSGYPSKSGIRALRYDVSSFFQQTIEKYCEPPIVKESSLSSRVFRFPGIDDHQLDEASFENKGDLASIASKVLMKALYGARCMRWELWHTKLPSGTEIAIFDCTN